jgi:glycosyltransferase involved in cell wall biosynthesis
MTQQVIPFPVSRAPAPARGEPRRIAFVINSLGPGGAERVMETVVRMAPAGWDRHLILLDRETERRMPPETVQVHRLDCKFRMLPSIAQLREKLVSIQPDLIVSFLVRANVAAVMAGRAIGVPVIISERSHLTTHLAERHSGPRRWAATLAPRLTYPRADHIIAVSNGVRSDLMSHFGVRPERIASIPNPYDLERIAREGEAPPEIPLPERFMVSVGRLVGAKGFEDLIDAYALADPDIPLCILGDGPDRDRLEDHIAARGLKRRVRMLGYAKNPFSIVVRADLFLSASHCEGFPNAMAEAMALGRPIIATDCPSGPAELLDDVEMTGANGVHDGAYGLLVPVRRPDILARAIGMMAEADIRTHYSRMALQRMDSFRIEKIVDRYWSTFANILDRQRDPTPRRQPRQRPHHEIA